VTRKSLFKDCVISWNTETFFFKFQQRK